MIKWIKDWFGYYRGECTLYGGKGYMQGMGFDMSYNVFEIKKLRIRIVTNIRIFTTANWIRDLKRRWNEDDEQQKLEKNRTLT